MPSVDILTFYLLIKWVVLGMAEAGALIIAFAIGELSGMRYPKD